MTPKAKAKRKAKTKLVIDSSVALKWQLNDEEYIRQFEGRTYSLNSQRMIVIAKKLE